MQSDNKGKNETIVSRLSKMQKEILVVLATMPQPVGDKITGLPGTGNIIDALRRQRTASSYAAISKALRRLEERGLVSGCRSTVALPGLGLRYYLTRGEPMTGRFGGTIFVLRRSKPTSPRYRNHMTIDA
jgi:hypothetical protein